MLLHFAKQYVKIQTLCFAKYFGQPLKTVGVHCFFTLSFESLTQVSNTKSDNQNGYRFLWRAVRDSNP